MSHIQSTVFVLWGDYFDEAAAIHCVTELRRAGKRVKLVAIQSRSAKGMNGVRITADMSLDNALTEQSNASRLIAPCSSNRFERLCNDPRVQKLVEVMKGRGVEVVGSSTH